MEKWSLAAFMILWNFNSIESGELCQGIDGQGLELRGSTQLSLTCNTSHLQAYAHFESGTVAVYSIGVACVDTNGSQSAYQIWDMNYFDGTELSSIVPHSHSLGSECTLFGCAAEDLIEYYAIHPAMCVIDEDECSLQTHNCSNRAVCSNTVGGYNCSCQNGYDGDGFSCNDKDECSGGAQSCSELSLCINTPGGYDCVCLEGYSGDGYHCTGIDECEPECNAHASCVHTDNIPSCVCGQMYEGDGSNCTAKDSYMDGIALEVSVIAAAVSLLLCLVITAAVIIITICCRRKQTWLSRIIDEWEVQKLDKNFHPVDPACMLSGSVKSVIEPLWEEQFLPQTNQDASGLQPQALRTSTSKSDIAVREKKRCADEEQQFLSVSTVNDVCAEHSSRLQSCTCEVADPQSDISIRDSSAESLDSKRPVAPFTSAFSQTKDESGFVSDTSSSVYLTFYPLNNNI